MKFNIASRTNATVIEISKSLLDVTILQISNYDLLGYDRNRNGTGVACYIKNNIGYLQNLIPKEVENIFTLILLPEAKPRII